MKSFSRGGLLVAIMDSVVSIFGLAFGAKLYFFIRTVDSFFSLSWYNKPETNWRTINSALNTDEFGRYSSYGSPFQFNDIIDRNFSIVYYLLFLYMMIYLFIFIFAIVLILGIQQESRFMIKMWWFPNVGLITLLTFLPLPIIFMDFVWSTRIYILWLCILGLLMFRAFQCWMVYEAQLEMSRHRNGQVHQRHEMFSLCAERNYGLQTQAMLSGN